MAQITLNSTGVASSGSLVLQSNGTTSAVTVDTAQNVGVGVTPSAWGSGFKAFEVGKAGSGFFSVGTDSLQLTNNYYYNGTNYVYAANGYAERYHMVTGQHQWYTAASGTAGNAISFTQAMTLDASGNLGVGATSPEARLHVSTSSTTPATIESTSSANYVKIKNSGGNGWVGSTGNALLFLTGSGDERARIGSSGYFKASNTGSYLSSTGTYHELISSTSGSDTAAIVNTSAGPYGLYVAFTGAAPNNTTNYFINGSDTSATRFVLRSNGGLANYSANNVNLSDRREKTNFAPAKSYLDVICAIPVQTYNYIDQDLENDGGLTLGVVAQDVQAVAPELVTESNWGTKEEPKMRLSIYQTDMQYALMKCIQEQQAIIEQLQADVAALKG